MEIHVTTIISKNIYDTNPLYDPHKRKYMIESNLNKFIITANGFPEFPLLPTVARKNIKIRPLD